jgi:aspartyl-tRNA(Asn)/glutamyl-tRNA(Gln) amidotransferase subunit A
LGSWRRTLSGTRRISIRTGSTPLKNPRSVTNQIAETIDRIQNSDNGVNSFVEILTSRAELEAQALDKQIKDDEYIGPLSGIAIGVKELFDVAGADNSYGSLTRTGSIALTDATVVAKLKKAGAIAVGTTRSHEFGWGITTQHESRGSTSNPWNPLFVPGGSSGGSAAAVSAGLVPLAVASDTGGSIRIPAAFCGVLGLKTTWGSISRNGGMSLAPSFDTPGFLSVSTKLLTEAFFATAGEDSNDHATLGTPIPSRVDHLFKGIHTVKCGISQNLNTSVRSKDRLNSILDLCNELKAHGASFTEITPPDSRECFEHFVPHQMAEAFHIHNTSMKLFPKYADKYGSDVRGRLEKASLVTASEYIEARRYATLVKNQFRQIFESVDVYFSLVGESGPSTISDPDFVVIDGSRQPLRNSVMPDTVPQNLAGLPSITFPYGAENGIPIGIQMTGPQFSEPILLTICSAMEKAGIITVPIPPNFEKQRSGDTKQL